MYRFERLERRPQNDPDPVTHIYRVIVRDDVTRNSTELDFPCNIMDDQASGNFRAAFETYTAGTFTPNDWT